MTTGSGDRDAGDILQRFSGRNLIRQGERKGEKKEREREREGERENKQANRVS